MKLINLNLKELDLTDSMKVVGGFSEVMSTFATNSGCKENNTSKSANTKAGCGSSKRSKKRKATGTNTNCSGNCVAKCGG